MEEICQDEREKIREDERRKIRKEMKWWLVILGEKGRRGSRERREMMLRCGGYTIIS